MSQLLTSWPTPLGQVCCDLTGEVFTCPPCCDFPHFPSQDSRLPPCAFPQAALSHLPLGLHSTVLTMPCPALEAFCTSCHKNVLCVDRRAGPRYSLKWQSSVLSFPQHPSPHLRMWGNGPYGSGPFNTVLLRPSILFYHMLDSLECCVISALNHLLQGDIYLELRFIGLG